MFWLVCLEQPQYSTCGVREEFWRWVVVPCVPVLSLNRQSLSWGSHHRWQSSWKMKFDALCFSAVLLMFFLFSTTAVQGKLFIVINFMWPLDLSLFTCFDDEWLIDWSWKVITLMVCLSPSAAIIPESCLTTTNTKVPMKNLISYFMQRTPLYSVDAVRWELIQLSADYVAFINYTVFIL